MKLIYITGIDGCGKTTQSKMLVEYLNDRSISAQYQWLRWSPSVGKIISFIKRCRFKNTAINVNDDGDIKSFENASFNRWYKMKNDIFSLSVFRFLWFKYSTWDYYHSYRNAAAGWNADIIVLDRYYFDFIVDQSLNYNETAWELDKRVKHGILKKLKQPDIFILIDIPPEVGWKRKRDGTSMEHLTRLSGVYDGVKLYGHVHIVDGTSSPQSVHNCIVDIISGNILSIEEDQ